MKWFKRIKESLGRKETAEAPPKLSIVPSFDEKVPAPLLSGVGGDEVRVAALSPREREVFDWLLAGKKQCEIANLLNVRPTTVSFHCTALYKKLGIHDKAQLFLRYARFLKAGGAI